MALSPRRVTFRIRSGKPGNEIRDSRIRQPPSLSPSLTSPPVVNTHGEKNTKHLESHCHRNQKIAGDNSVSMIPDERTPVLRRGSGARSSAQLLRPVFADGSWRNADAEF